MMIENVRDDEWVIRQLTDQRMQPFWTMVNDVWKRADGALRTDRDVSHLRAMEAVESIQAIPKRLAQMQENSKKKISG